MNNIEAMKMALDFLESGDFVYPTEIAQALRQAISEAEQAEQEPVAEYLGATSISGDVFRLNKNIPVGTKLYTAPPQREWVSLTDDEVVRLWKLSGGLLNVFAKTYEAKLKEKNT